jgi:hypothetical protein
VRGGLKGDYWIGVHEWGSNAFYMYALTITGLSDPVVSNIGTIYTTDQIQNTYGQMKFSPCGDKLAAAAGYLDTVDVFDFDLQTGIVSNRVALPMVDHVYGVEFSPNGEMLYATTYNPYGPLLQFELTAGSQEEIFSSLTPITYTPDLYALQLGSDGKIYVCKSFSPFLDVIEYPDLDGLDCSYVFNAVNLDPGYEGVTSGLGLPNFVASYVAPEECLAVGHEFLSTARSPEIFPNPSAGTFTLAVAEMNATVMICDIAGQIVETIEISGRPQLAFGQAYLPGVYFCRVKSRSGSAVYKIVKE